MPKITHMLPQEREEEIARRILTAKAKVAALPPMRPGESSHTTEAKARNAAVRLGMPNTGVGAVNTAHGWVGIVQIRQDQEWMRRTIEGQGCRAVMDNT